MKSGVRQKMHVSWQLAAVSWGVLAGIAAAGSWRLPVLAAAWQQMAVVASSLFVVALIHGGRAALVLAVLAGLGFGLWRGGSQQLALRAYQPLYGRPLTIRGQVAEDASYGRQGDLRVQLSDVRALQGDSNAQHLPGTVWVSLLPTASRADVKRSDLLTVSGVIGQGFGFGNIPASMPRAQLSRIERPRPGDVALQVRDWFGAGIRRAIPEPQASLGAGFLVGQRSALPSGLDDELKIAGLTHIVVASGYNLTVLVGFARRSLMKTSKYLATLAGVLLVAGFVLITGLSPSMTRAGLVTLLGLAAWYYGRPVHPLVLLPLAAAITAIANPSYIWGDMGWFLSFGSFAGVLLLAPLLHRYFWGEGEPGTLRQVLVETASAQLATLPVILFAFSQYSPYALLANIIILPLIPLAMILTFAAGIAGLALPALAHLAGAPATGVLFYMTSAVHWVAGLPGSQGTISFNILALSLSYLTLSAGIVYMWRRTGYQFRDKPLIGDEP